MIRMSKDGVLSLTVNDRILSLQILSFIQNIKYLINNYSDVLLGAKLSFYYFVLATYVTVPWQNFF